MYFYARIPISQLNIRERERENTIGIFIRWRAFCLHNLLKLPENPWESYVCSVSPRFVLSFSHSLFVYLNLGKSNKEKVDTHTNTHIYLSILWKTHKLITFVYMCVFFLHLMLVLAVVIWNECFLLNLWESIIENDKLDYLKMSLQTKHFQSFSIYIYIYICFMVLCVQTKIHGYREIDREILLC